MFSLHRKQKILQSGRQASVAISASHQSLVTNYQSSLCYNPIVATVSQSVRVKVLFFGRLKDLAGHAEDSLDLPDAATIEQLFALCTAKNPELAKFRPSVVASRNQEFAAWDTPLHSGDEVAFLPPVSGG
jgi:molybdopterin converting factor subunit 1